MTLRTTGKGDEVVREVVAEGACDHRLRGLLVHEEVGGEVAGGSGVQEPPVQPGSSAEEAGWPLPQAELAGRVGVSLGTVKAWESGRRLRNRRPSGRWRTSSGSVRGPGGARRLGRRGGFAAVAAGIGLDAPEAAERLGVEPFTLQRVEEGLGCRRTRGRWQKGVRVSRMELAAAARRVVS